jgi:hypothetical protein
LVQHSQCGFASCPRLPFKPAARYSFPAAQ